MRAKIRAHLSPGPPPSAPHQSGTRLLDLVGMSETAVKPAVLADAQGVLEVSRGERWPGSVDAEHFGDAMPVRDPVAEDCFGALGVQLVRARIESPDRAEAGCWAGGAVQVGRCQFE